MATHESLCVTSLCLGYHEWITVNAVLMVCALIHVVFYPCSSCGPIMCNVCSPSQEA